MKPIGWVLIVGGVAIAGAVVLHVVNRPTESPPTAPQINNPSDPTQTAMHIFDSIARFGTTVYQTERQIAASREARSEQRADTRYTPSGSTPPQTPAGQPYSAGAGFTGTTSPNVSSIFTQFGSRST